MPAKKNALLYEKPDGRVMIWIDGMLVERCESKAAAATYCKANGLRGWFMGQSQKRDDAARRMIGEAS